jgi:hypothetical protein
MNTNPKSRNNLVCKKLGDEAMLYDPTNENVHVLNITSLFIWNHLNGKNTPSDIEVKMRENFTIPQEVDLSTDIAKTISDFRAKGLLEA